MTPSNFNWFLHVMLFYHTRLVLEKQASKTSNVEEKDHDDDDDDDDTGDNID
jgi:hypothetical protein